MISSPTMKKPVDVSILGVRAPDELILTTIQNSPDVEALYLDLSGKLLDDWHKHPEKRSSVKIKEHQEVVVFEPDWDMECNRGYTYKDMGDGVFLVFLYDSFTFRAINMEFMRNLKEEFKQVAPRSSILKIPGLIPKQETKSCNGDMVCSSLCDLSEGGMWDPQSFEAHNNWNKEWLEQSVNIKLSVTTQENRVLIIGDLVVTESRSNLISRYSEYLCRNNFCVRTNDQYDQDVQSVQECENLLTVNSSNSNALAESTNSAKMNYQKTSRISDEASCAAISSMSIPVQETKIEPISGTEMSIVDSKSTKRVTASSSVNTQDCSLFARVYDPDNCFENAYSAVGGKPNANNRVGAFDNARVYDANFRSKEIRVSNPESVGRRVTVAGKANTCASASVDTTSSITTERIKALATARIVAVNTNDNSPNRISNSSPTIVKTKEKINPFFIPKDKTSGVNSTPLPSATNISKHHSGVPSTPPSLVKSHVRENDLKARNFQLQTSPSNSESSNCSSNESGTKPFVCTLPPWSEVKNKARKTIESSPSSSTDSGSIDSGHKTKPMRRVPRKNPFVNRDKSLEQLNIVSGGIDETDIVQNRPKLCTSSSLNVDTKPVIGNGLLNTSGNSNGTAEMLSSKPAVLMQPETVIQPQEEKHIGKNPPSTNVQALQESQSKSTVVLVRTEPMSLAQESLPSACHQRYSYDADNLLRMIQERVFVYGKSPSPPYSSWSEFPYLKIVKDVVYTSDFKKINSKQKNAVPNIIHGRNVVIFDNDKTGKSLSYIIPIVAKIMQDVETTSKHCTAGPFAVFLTSSVKQVTNLYSHIQPLLDATNAKKTSGHFVIQNDEATRVRLEGGCDIMITTPDCFLEMIKKVLTYFSFQRLTYFVIDNMDILINTNAQVLAKVLKALEDGLTCLGSRECPFQTVFVGNAWSKTVEAVTRTVVDPILVLGPLQAVVFAGVRTFVEYSQNKAEKLQQFLKVIGSLIASHEIKNKIIIVCQNNTTVNMVAAEIRDKYGRSVHKVFHGDGEDPKDYSGQIDRVRQCWVDASPTELQIIACTDAVIKELRITDAFQLIHYDVPSKFETRFCTMWAWFRSKEDMNAEVKQPTSHFFLTSKKEENNLMLIVPKLKTLRATIPESLVTDFDAMLAASELENKLCTDFLLFGTCNGIESGKCARRHKFLAKDVTESGSIPMTGQVEVRIITTYTLSSYAARLVSHYEQEDGKMKLVFDYDKELRRRSEFLETFYANPENRVELSDDIGSQYFAFLDKRTSRYLRAKVDRYVTRESNHPTYFDLFCLDRGDVVCNKIDNTPLYKLPEGFGSEMTSFSVDLFLANIKPLLGEREYLSTHKSEAAKRINDESIFYGRICLSIGQRIWVDQLLEMHGDGGNKRIPSRSVRIDYFQRKYAESNPEHMNALYRSCEEAGISCKKYEHLGANNLGTEFTKLFHCKDDPLQWAHLPLYMEDSPESVVMWSTYVVTIDAIFCNQEKFANQLSELLSDMDDEINKLIQRKNMPEPNALIKYLEVGMPVACRDPTTKSWTRGIITNVVEEGVDQVFYNIFMADTGEDVFDVGLTELYPIPKQFVRKLPFQAIAIKLGHVSPAAENGESVQWSKEAFEFMCNSLIPDDKGYSSTVDVIALSKVRNSDYVRCRYYEACIILGDVELGEKLVQAKFANYTQEGEALVKKVKTNLLEAVMAKIDPVLGDVNKTDEESQESSDDGFDYYISREEAMKYLGLNDLPSEPTPKCLNSTKAIMVPPSSTTNFNVDNSAKLPKTTWSQTQNEINIRLDIIDVTSYNLKLQDDKKTLNFESFQPPDYRFEIILFKKVDPNAITVSVLGACLKIKLVKRLPNVPWPRLTHDTRRCRWIKHEMDGNACDGHGSSSDDDDHHLNPVKPKRKEGHKGGDYIQVEYDNSTSSDDEFVECSEFNNLME